ADDFNGGIDREELGQPGAHEVVIVGDEDTRHRLFARYGRRARIMKVPLLRSMSRVPPSAAARSCIPTRPCPLVDSVAWCLRTEVVTRSSNSRGPYSVSTRAVPAPWRDALVSASWRMRYAAWSTARLTGRHVPADVYAMSSPASACWPIRPPSDARLSGAS